ncbi:MAG: hypothetical protein M1834_000512 [Cirrosporium novae-zelandiae]|nr:MAG: hypothetical protein M1834_000512 [Cirrosporium novae-zelandiae]
MLGPMSSVQQAYQASTYSTIELRRRLMPLHIKRAMIPSTSNRKADACDPNILKANTSNP